MSDWFYAAFLEPLTAIYFQKAMVGGCLVAIVCGVMGCFIILRRMAFLGDALSHAMLAGVTGGYLFMRIAFGREADAAGMLIGSLLAAGATVSMVWFISRASRIKEDTAIGIMYTGIFALGGILASLFHHLIHVDLYHFVMGQVLAVSDSDIWVAGVVAAFVLSVVILLYRQLELTSFDPVMAASIGIPVAAMDYLLTACTSFVVVSAVTMVGVILVVGLLVTPAATAYLLCDRLSRMLVMSAVFAVTSVAAGLYLALWANVAGGSAIVMVSTVQFFVVLVIAPRYGLAAGWLRRFTTWRRGQRTVPRPIVEDVISSILRGGGQSPVRAVADHVDARPEQIQRALASLEQEGLLSLVEQTASLTDAGLREARRVVRAHRLWETYLEQAGTPQEEIHRRAHQLEHVHDEATVDYLDDKLGHPLRDPHGSEIPEDIAALTPGATLRASLLREGRRGVVESVASPGAPPLAPGMKLTVGPRREEGAVWTFVLDDGAEVALDHAAADAVLVRLDENE